MPARLSFGSSDFGIGIEVQLPDGQRRRRPRRATRRIATRAERSRAASDRRSATKCSPAFQSQSLCARRNFCADEGEEDRHHEQAGAEDAEGDEHAELREARGLAEQKTEERGGGGERAEDDAPALAAERGGDGALVVGAGFALALVDGVEHHAEIDAEADEDRAEADGDHVQLVKDERAEGDRDHAAKREHRHDGAERADAAEAERRKTSGDEHDGADEGGDDIAAHRAAKARRRTACGR